MVHIFKWHNLRGAGAHSAVQPQRSSTAMANRARAAALVVLIALIASDAEGLQEGLPACAKAKDCAFTNCAACAKGGARCKWNWNAALVPVPPMAGCGGNGVRMNTTLGSCDCKTEMEMKAASMVDSTMAKYQDDAHQGTLVGEDSHERDNADDDSLVSGQRKGDAMGHDLVHAGVG